MPMPQPFLPQQAKHGAKAWCCCSFDAFDIGMTCAATFARSVSPVWFRTADPQTTARYMQCLSIVFAFVTKKSGPLPSTSHKTIAMIFGDAVHACPTFVGRIEATARPRALDPSCPLGAVREQSAFLCLDRALSAS